MADTLAAGAVSAAAAGADPGFVIGAPLKYRVEVAPTKGIFEMLLRIGH
jgi:hypothetical protein